LLAQHDDLLVTRPILVCAKHPSEHRRDAEDLEEVAGDACADNPFGTVAIGEVEAGERIGGEPREGRAAFAPGVEAAERDAGREYPAPRADAAPLRARC
jgi:hypothetical protein